MGILLRQKKSVSEEMRLSPKQFSARECAGKTLKTDAWKSDTHPKESLFPHDAVALLRGWKRSLTA